MIICRLRQYIPVPNVNLHDYILQWILMRIVMHQEPLGVVTDIISPNNLRRWSETNPIPYLTDYSAIGEVPAYSTPPFQFDHELNHKLVLW